MARILFHPNVQNEVFSKGKKKYYEKYVSFTYYINSFLMDRHEVLFYY